MFFSTAMKNVAAARPPFLVNSQARPWNSLSFIFKIQFVRASLAEMSSESIMLEETSTYLGCFD